VKTILVVDDEEAVVEFVASLLEESDYHILRAYDGRSALELARSERPDLILSDIMMPIMDGIEFCQALRETAETANIPIILMTAGRSTNHACLGVTVLPKPFDLTTLEQTVAQKLSDSSD
jgi:CheY-like chemotaxis protein